MNSGWELDVELMRYDVYGMRELCIGDADGFTRIGGHISGLMESLGWLKEGQMGVEKGMEVVDMQHEEEAERITVEFA